MSGTFPLQEQNILRPYRKLIDEYVLRFDASPKRYGPSQRVAAARFIEECVVITGRLPQGVQAITLGSSTSYSGGDHDFTPLGVLARERREVIHFLWERLFIF